MMSPAGQSLPAALLLHSLSRSFLISLLTQKLDCCVAVHLTHFHRHILSVVVTERMVVGNMQAVLDGRGIVLEVKIESANMY